MVRDNEMNSAQRIAAAARLLFEGHLANPAMGRYSRTVFLADKGADTAIERETFNVALARGIGVVSLRFARKSGAMPRRANIRFPHEGSAIEVRDCVIWSADCGSRLILVPWDGREDCHYAVGANGLERRSGRPAEPLGKGMSLAKTRVEQAVKGLRTSDIGPCITGLRNTDVA